MADRPKSNTRARAAARQRYIRAREASAVNPSDLAAIMKAADAAAECASYVDGEHREEWERRAQAYAASLPRAAFERARLAFESWRASLAPFQKLYRTLSAIEDATLLLSRASQVSAEDELHRRALRNMRAQVFQRVRTAIEADAERRNDGIMKGANRAAPRGDVFAWGVDDA